MHVLIIGGTGPSGGCIVEEMLARGKQVTVLHSGAHERKFSAEVAHLHADLQSAEALAAALKGQRFHAAVNTAARVKTLLEVLPGRIDKLVTISGAGVYEGATLTGFDQFGAVLPLSEDAPLRTSMSSQPFYYSVVRAERAALKAHLAGKFAVTILRYPVVYGPHAYWRNEWYFVKRVLDGRRQLLLPGDGTTLLHRGHAANLARAVALALESPAANGQTYNAGDERVLSTRQIADLAAEVFDHVWELVGVPFDWAPDAGSFFARRHLMLDLTKIKAELGYRDVVAVEEGTREYLRWLADNPTLPGSSEAAWLGDVFDYVREDEIIARAKNAMALR